MKSEKERPWERKRTVQYEPHRQCTHIVGIVRDGRKTVSTNLGNKKEWRKK